jgi:hypothetical protein
MYICIYICIYVYMYICIYMWVLRVWLSGVILVSFYTWFWWMTLDLYRKHENDIVKGYLWCFLQIDWGSFTRKGRELFTSQYCKFNYSLFWFVFIILCWNKMCVYFKYWKILVKSNIISNFLICLFLFRW